MDKEVIDSHVNNNCEGCSCFETKARTNINLKLSSNETITKARAVCKHHITDNSTKFQICLDDAVPDSIKKDNDVMMSCPDRICTECGNDHSFSGNFEGVIGSIDLIPELLYGMKIKVKEV
jgi:hypothetical protein